jgi:hypothetical protein
MRIVGANSSVSTFLRQVAREATDGAAVQAESTALTPIEPARSNENAPRLTRHSCAPFVAHLLATWMQAPQTRERRRAEPDEAIAIYRSMTKPVTAPRLFGAQASLRGSEPPISSPRSQSI